MGRTSGSQKASSTDELVAQARKVTGLLRGLMKGLPSTDLRADALAACAELDQLCDEASS